MKYWAGIGSRTISRAIAKDMGRIASILESDGYTLRSGNATGSDQAFALGVENNAQILLPWKDFNLDFQLAHPKHTYQTPIEFDKEALESVGKFHPAPHKLDVNGVLFMSRNFRQIIGLNSPDSQFVICWTHDGTDVGGTGQAMRIASSRYIPVYNMFTLSVEQI